MTRWTAIGLVVVLAASSAAHGAVRAQEADRQTLKSEVLERFDVVPLTDGTALRPKSPVKDVRLIEINESAVLVNGIAATGQELRGRLGADADLLLRLSYLPGGERQALFEPPAPGQRATPQDLPIEIPSDQTAPTVAPPSPSEADDVAWRIRRSSGDRVRIFGDVAVDEQESVSGQVVAVLGSVRIDGEVGGQVVAVLGSVTLGPKAVVHADVVSVGGRVRRAPGARIGGGVTEVSIAEPNVHLNFTPLFGRGPGVPFVNGSGVVDLVGSTLRFFLLVLLASIALVVARPTIEASADRVSGRPVQTTLIGLCAEVLLVPAIVLTVVILAISIIGIPLLLLVPFGLLLLVLMALAGFSGTVYAVGQATRRRLSVTAASPFVDVFLGVTIVLLPVLVARVIGLVSWPGTPLTMILLVLGVAVEFLAWSAGFGAVVSTTFARWQARRAARSSLPASLTP